jgi:hypothetical protein
MNAAPIVWVWLLVLHGTGPDSSQPRVIARYHDEQTCKADGLERARKAMYVAGVCLAVDASLNPPH